MKKIVNNRPHEVDIKISLLGIRRLVRATENSEIEICLTKFPELVGTSVQETAKKMSSKRTQRTQKILLQEQRGDSEDDLEKSMRTKKDTGVYI